MHGFPPPVRHAHSRMTPTYNPGLEEKNTIPAAVRHPSLFDLAKLNVEVAGSNNSQPVLLLHGWGSNAANMRVISDALHESYRIYNIDLPGHGLTPPPAAPMDLNDHARLIFHFIRERIGTQVTIIGHSNGGRIALYLASDPEMKQLIRSLILISPSGVEPERSAGFYIRKYIAQILKAPFEILPGRLREFSLDWLRHSLVWRLLGSSDYRALEGVMRDTFVRLVTHHVDDRLGYIDAPTLLVWGTHDSAISMRQMRILEEKISDAGLVTLEGAGHYGYLDDFGTFMAVTHHFLENT